MTRAGVAGLAAYYRELSANYRVVDRSADYANLVVPNGNETRPVYRWFRYKEAFSHGLLDRVLKDRAWEGKDLRLCDPFVGSGTSLLSAAQNSSVIPTHAVGVERNPFVATVARAKCAAVIEGPKLVAQLKVEYRRLLQRYRRYLADGRDLTTRSATLHNTRFFPDGHAAALVALGRSAEKCRDDRVRAILQTCVASAIEGAGYIRRDGRALRYAIKRSLVHPVVGFKRAFEVAMSDVRSCELAPEGSVLSVIEGDARRALEMHRVGDFNCAVFSPPYPNNIDYTEIYKLECWVLGFFQTQLDMRKQRLSTMRSHPSVIMPEDSTVKHRDELMRIVGPVLRAVPQDDRYTKGRVQVIRGYAEDMLRVFSGLHSSLRPGSPVACVVGNSVHGRDGDRFVIASDLILCAVAELAGFEVRDISIARKLRRRGADGSGFERESVLNLLS